MKESIEAMLWDFIIDNNIATEDEVRLVHGHKWLERGNDDRHYLCQDWTTQLRAV